MIYTSIILFFGFSIFSANRNLININWIELNRFYKKPQVKLRLVMGVYTFVFGWKLSLFTKTKQFWSVPFVTEKTRIKYLKSVKKDIKRDILKYSKWKKYLFI